VTLFLVLLAVLVVAVAGAAVVARTQKRKFAQANQVIPGMPTRAPASWAGAHSPEARLHRRLRDAMTALRANPGLATVGFMDALAALQVQAVAVDDALVAAAALPERLRAKPLADAEAAVVVENAVAALAAQPAADARADLDRALAEATERVELLARARTELEGGGAGTGGANPSP
jgi:hypothetical protein